jgi:four helix bundle protein
MNARSFKDLRIWQNGKTLTIEIYRLTEKFPRNEEFGLTSQMRRAAVSIPANIAEGFNRDQSKEFKRYLHIALGSCAELETFIEIVKDLNYISFGQFEDFCKKINLESKMVMSYIKRLDSYHQPSTITH